MQKVLLISITSFLFLINYSAATTYYLSKSGNDANAGTSWANAWQTIDKINAAISAGDTVRFGAGRWYDSQIRPPLGGSFGNRTVYSCSTYATPADPDGSDSWLLASISAGDSVTGWTQYSGNIYSAVYTGSQCWYSSPYGANAIQTVSQDDILLWPQTSLAAVDGPGKFYQPPAENELYVWCYNNLNPNSLEILASCRPAVYFDDSSQDHILFVGLDFRMGKQATVLFNAGADSVFFVHCNITRASHESGENPGCIMSRAQDVGANPENWGEYNSFIACSLGQVVYIGNVGSYEHHGCGAITYAQRYMLFDSCAVYDLPGTGIKFKNDNINASPSNPSEGNVVRFSSFENIGSYGIELGRYAYRDSIYGNTFSNITMIGIFIGMSEHYGGNFICNNTFYDMSQFWWDRVQPGTELNELKYNVFYQQDDKPANDWFTYFMALRECPSCEQYWDINYNIYYDTDEGFSGYCNGGGSDFAGWQSCGFDINGLWSDPGLNNPSIGDFARPSSSQEMNLTYGGRTWTRWGAWQTDTPPPPPDEDPPGIGGINSTNISHNSASIVWTTDETATSQVDYGLTPALGLSTNLDQILVYNHQVDLINLDSDILYYYRVRASDASGNESVSSVFTFQTDPIPPPDTDPPVISIVESSGITESSSIITWATDEPATSQVEYGLTQNYGTVSNLDTNLVINHQIIISGLTAGTICNYRVRSTDAADNESISGNFSFQTDSVGSFENIALGAVSQVSGTYTGYSTTPINDGIINPYNGSATTWASNESSVNPHWIEINFGQDKTVRSIRIYWAWNNSSSSWMRSQNFNTQYWSETFGGFIDIQTLMTNEGDSVASADFSPVNTSRIRLFQPANMGPPDYPVILWLTEFEIYGSDSSTIPAPLPLSTTVDSLSGAATVTSSTVSAYTPVYYEFALDSVETFTFPRIEPALIVGVDASTTFDNLLEEYTYFWRCRAVAQNHSDTSEWSAITTFSLGTVNVVAVSGEYPSDGEIVLTNAPVFLAQYPPEVTNVFFEVADNIDFNFSVTSGAIQTSSSGEASWQITIPFEQSGTYFWRSSSDNIVWSSPIVFTAQLNIHAYPVPFRKSSGHTTITFTNIPVDSRITIAAVSGAIIISKNNLGPEDWVWDLKNKNSKDVASGVYLYNVDFSSGSSNGKLIVIR